MKIQDEDENDDEEDGDDDEARKKLTADSFTVPVNFIDLRIHIYVHLGFLCNLLVTGVHPLLHPLCEWLADQGHDDVDDILPIEIVM